MKKIRNILIALSICSTSWAQTTAPTHTQTGQENALFENGKVSFGIKAGLSYSTLYGEGKETGYVFAGKPSYAPGYHFGLQVNNKINKNFWLKHELIFNHKVAGILLNDSDNNPYNSKLKMSYLELQPVNLTFHLKGFQVYAGPYISALAGAQISLKDEEGNFFDDHSIYGTANNDESEHKYLQKIDFGINTGLEYQLPVGLSIGAKYTYGLTDIFQHASGYSPHAAQSDIKMYNRGFMVVIGYMFK